MVASLTIISTQTNTLLKENIMKKQLIQILEMLNNKEIFLAIECAESIGFELNSRALPSLKMEVTALIEHAAMNEEAESLTVTF